jgi:hypothetical protein
MKTKDEELKDARNEDPITGEPGSHPVGVGVGTAAGAAAGGAIGAAGGPVGAVVGAVVGGIAGAAAGKTAGEAVNPTVEDAYWRENHARQDYANADDNFDDFGPAYRAGYEGPSRYRTSYDEAEGEISRNWEKDRGSSRLGWDRAKHAVRAGWIASNGRSPAMRMAMAAEEFSRAKLKFRGRHLRSEVPAAFCRLAQPLRKGFHDEYRRDHQGYGSYPAR